MQEITKNNFPIQYSSWRVIAISSLIVFFVLAVFQPFGLSSQAVEKWFRIIGFTLITTLSTAVVTVVFPFIFKKYYSIENWTLGKYLMDTALIFLLIGVGNFLFAWTVIDKTTESFWDVFFSYFLSTFLVGIIPITLITYINQNNVLKTNLKEATLINEQLVKKSTNSNLAKTNNEAITLTGTTKESLLVLPQDIVYMEASGNYVKVTYLVAGKGVKNTLLRTTISCLEKALLAYPIIQRSHRAFLVNILHVINVDGNMQGFMLGIEHSNTKIPVSRTFAKRIKTALAQRDN